MINNAKVPSYAPPATVTTVAAKPKPKVAPKKTAPKAAAKKKPAAPSVLDAPAAPGSGYTERQIRSLLATLTSQQFGPQQQALQTREQQIPVWFADYRSKLAGLQGAQQGAQQAQVSSLQGLASQAAGDTGLPAGADPAAVQRAQAAAQMRSAGIGNQAALAQSLGQTQNDYLGNLGALSFNQEFGANNDLAGKRQLLAGQKGDFQTTQRQQILSDEASNALKAALTGSQIGENTAQTAAAEATTSKTKAETKKTKADAKFFKENGYYPKTGPTAKKSPDVITSGPFAGYTKTQVAGMTPAKKTELTAKAEKETKADSPYLGQKDQNNFRDSYEQAKSLVAKYKGQYTRSDLARMLLNGRPASTVEKDGVKVQVPAIPKIGSSEAVSAALDAVLDGHLSPYTVKKAHTGGYKVNQLGASTKRPKPKAKPKPAPRALPDPIEDFRRGL